MGLIYAEHNFTENFLCAVGADDDFMKTDIVIDEIGRIISTDKNRMVKMLRDSGVDASYADSALRISELTQSEIANNPEFTNKLSKYIVDSRSSNTEVENFFGSYSADAKDSDDDDYENAKGKDKKKEKDKKERGKVFKGASELLKDDKTKQAVSTVLASVMDSAFKKKGKTSTMNTPSAGEQLNDRVRQNELINAKRKRNYTWLYIGVGATVVAVAGYFVYRGMKKKFSKGGEVATSTEPTEPKPTILTM